MKTLYDYNEKYEEFLELEDDEWIFSKGACHAFAIELWVWFSARGGEPQLHYVTGYSEDLARHVFVKLGAFYWDVFRKKTAADMAERWADSDESRIRPVQHVGWISVARPDSKISFLGLIVEPKFFELARARARQFILANPTRYTLPS